jgi:hypothetical protein
VGNISRGINFSQPNENSIHTPNQPNASDMPDSPILRLSGGIMDIYNKLRSLVSRRNACAYECWMCGQGHDNAVAYLWHINACNLERSGTPIMLCLEDGTTYNMGIKVMPVQ